MNVDRSVEVKSLVCFGNHETIESRTQGERNLTCREIRRLGAAVSALNLDQISAIDNNEIFECIGVFGAINDYQKEKVNKVAEKYIMVLENRLKENRAIDLHFCFRRWKDVIVTFNR